MKLFSALALGVTTVATILLMWVRAKWATALPEVAMCLLAALWALVGVASKRKLALTWSMLPLAAVVGLAVLQIAAGITVNPWPTRMAALYWIGNLATFFVALQFLRDRESRVRYLDALMAFGALLCVFSMVHALTSGSLIYWTFEDPQAPFPLFGPFLYVNQYAAFVELVLPLAIYNGLTKDRGRIVSVLAVAIMFGSVVYSGSRGGSVLVVLELVVVPLLVARRFGITRQKLMNTGAILMVAILWVAVGAGPDKLIDKLVVDDQFSARREFNQSSLAMIKARPIQGFGLGNWATAYPGFASFDDGLYANQAHNDWAQWTVEGGIPMLLLMLAVAVWAVPRAVRSGWGLGVAVVLVHCLWDYPIQRTGVALVFFTMLAAIAPYGVPNAPERLIAEPED